MIEFGAIDEDAEQGATDTVTIRDRNSLKQVRIPVKELVSHIIDK